MLNTSSVEYLSPDDMLNDGMLFVFSPYASMLAYAETTSLTLMYSLISLPSFLIVNNAFSLYAFTIPGINLCVLLSPVP